MDRAFLSDDTSTPSFNPQIPYKEDFDDLELPEGSVDTIVSTYMWCVSLKG
jgi:hypothetical protein